MTAADDATAAARRLAASAALRNTGVTACPYPADGTSVQSAARHAWISEYLRRRPQIGAVDFRSDLDYLAGGDDLEDGAAVDLAEADEPQVPNVLLTLQEAMGPAGAKLLQFWTKGKGAAEIRWGEDDDFKRCVKHLRDKVADPEGLCHVYHVAAVGAPPGKGH